jgi:hypothetical protein
MRARRAVGNSRILACGARSPTRSAAEGHAHDGSAEVRMHKREAGRPSAPLLVHPPSPRTSRHESPAPSSPQTLTPVLHPSHPSGRAPLNAGPAPTQPSGVFAPSSEALRPHPTNPDPAPLNAGPVLTPSLQSLRPLERRAPSSLIPGVFAPSSEALRTAHPSHSPPSPGSPPPSGDPGPAPRSSALRPPWSASGDVRLPCRSRPGFRRPGSTCGSTGPPRTRPRGASPTRTRWDRSPAR